MIRPEGIDISFWQQTYEPKNPIDFIIQRVTTGIDVDGAYDQIKEDIQVVPIKGAYHYLRSSFDWEYQADLFLEWSADHDFLVCDVEPTNNIMTRRFAEDAGQFCARVKSISGKETLLYTNRPTYQEHMLMLGVTWMSEWPLWIAQYPYKAWNDRLLEVPDTEKGWNPVTPAGRPGWKFWQYTHKGKGIDWGVDSWDVDLNVFNGTLDELRQWLKIDEPVPPTPPVPVPPGPTNQLESIQMHAKKIITLAEEIK